MIFKRCKELSKAPGIKDNELCTRITSLEFIKQFLDSIKINKADSFIDKHRSIQNLTILKIEDFEGKDGSSNVLKDIGMNRNKTTLVLRMKKSEILKSDRFNEDF